MWVFGYGSLMWNPGFPIVSRSRARLSGYRRALCIHSTHYRGTLQRPGLVFGLDRGGVCDGVAFEIAAENKADVLAGLRKRELIYGVYREVRTRIALEPNVPSEEQARRTVEAVTYVAERAHPSFAGDEHPQRQAAIVRGAHGIAGSNLAYLINTIVHLRGLGVRDRKIERVGQMAAMMAYASDPDDQPANLANSGPSESPRITALSAAWRRNGGIAKPLPNCGQSRFQHRAKIGGAL